MSRLVEIAKAAATAPDMIRDVTIVIRGQPPEFSMRESLDEIGAWYEGQARHIEEALYASLPGGTYDRLTALMLARKATHFRVPHAPAVQPARRGRDEGADELELDDGAGDSSAGYDGLAF